LRQWLSGDGLGALSLGRQCRGDQARGRAKDDGRISSLRFSGGTVRKSFHDATLNRSRVVGLRWAAHADDTPRHPMDAGLPDRLFGPYLAGGTNIGSKLWPVNSEPILRIVHGIALVVDDRETVRSFGKAVDDGADRRPVGV